MTTKHPQPPKDCEIYYSLSFQEVVRSFGIPSQTIIEIVQEGIVQVKEDNPETWDFDHQALRDIRTALQLHKDLGVNVAGAALALELLKEIDRLRVLLNAEKAIDQN